MKKQILLVVLAISFSATAFTQKMGTAFPIKVGDKNIESKMPYAAPLIVDYDKDGLQDLIVGTLKGSFKFYKNIGFKSVPKYKGFSLVQANGKNAVAPNW